MKKRKTTKPKKVPMVAGNCIFCGGGPMSKQHIWPNWMHSVIPGKEPANYHATHDYGLSTNGMSKKYKVYEGRMNNTKLRKLCTTCNNEWMSLLEEDLKAPLIPLMLNEPIVLSKDDQDLIALWAVLATVIYEFRDETTRTVPKNERLFLYEKEEIPTGWQVWIAKKSQAVFQYKFHHRAIVFALEQGNFRAQLTAFGVGNILLFTTRLPLGYHLPFSIEYRDKMVPIHPLYQKTVDMANVPFLTDSQVQKIIDTYYTTLMSM